MIGPDSRNRGISLFFKEDYNAITSKLKVADVVDSLNLILTSTSTNHNNLDVKYVSHKLWFDGRRIDFIYELPPRKDIEDFDNEYTDFTNDLYALVLAWVNNNKTEIES